MSVKLFTNTKKNCTYTNKTRNLGNQPKISYGILLFQAGKLLVLENTVSYAFSSFLNALTTQNPIEHDELFIEFTPDEITLLKTNWKSDRLKNLVQAYLERAFQNNPKDRRVKQIVQQKFDRNHDIMQTNWECLIQIVNPDKLPSVSYPRTHDVPKARGPESRKWKIVQSEFKTETKNSVPSNTIFKCWVPVQYSSNDGMQYYMDLLVGNCSGFVIPENSRAKWLSPNELNFVPEIMDIIKKYC